jgi:hypothetical protein
VRGAPAQRGALRLAQHDRCDAFAVAHTCAVRRVGPGPADAACQPDRGLAAAPMAASVRRATMTLLTQAVMVRANIDVDRMPTSEHSCSPGDPRAAGQDGMTGRSRQCPCPR